MSKCSSWRQQYDIHTSKKCVMTLKLMYWHQNGRHNFKNTSWRQKFVMTLKSSSWRQTFHEVKNCVMTSTNSSSQIIRDVKKSIMRSKICYDAKTLFMTYTIRHYVKHTSFKNTSWCQNVRRDIKNTSWSQQVRHEERHRHTIFLQPLSRLT